MPSEGVTEVWRQHRQAQDKYTYFLLAAASAAIAFAVQKTEAISLSWTLAPVGLAVLAWGGSFYCGCKNLVWVQSSAMANYSLLQLQAGIHPQQPSHPAHVEAAISGVRSALESNIRKAQAHAIWQFRLLILGALLFLAWHVWRLYVLAVAA